MKLNETYQGRDGMMRGAAPSVSLRSGVPHRLAAVPYMREFLKLQLRALLHRRHTRHWLGLLNSHPAFSEYVQQCPRLLHKIYRPYLTTQLCIGDRLAVLGAHYHFMFRHGLGQLIGRATRGGVALASVAGKTGKQYQVWLRAVEPMERDGELVLQLHGDGVLVYSAAFTFSDLEGFPIVSIGCIQGPRHGDGLNAIREATRELHGLRPKQLLAGLVRHLGYQLGCAQLRLVGNANRVVRGAMRQGKVLADYDQLWQEMGAVRRADGDFQLRCGPLAALDLERICSKKRSEARKRHAVGAALADAVARHFCERPPLALVPACEPHAGPLAAAA